MHAFDVLADPVRRRILELLASEEQTAGDVVTVIQAEFGISQSAVSQHLRVLRESGFALARRDGAKRRYSIQAEALAKVDDWLESLKAAWAPRFEALATEVERGKRRRGENEPA